MKISISNLEQGIERLLRENRWSTDFINEQYYDIYEDRRNGLTEDWLNAALNRLAKWKAIRAPKKPNTKEEIRALIMSHLDNIRREYAKIIGSTKGEPCIDNVTWKDVSSLYRNADEIKNHSPVFASKMCHFIFPKVFIVMDNLLTGTTDDYEYYWEGSVREWTKFNEKEKAIELLSTKIVKGSSKPIHVEYPFETKIIELCNIGKKHGRSGQTDTNNNMG